MQLFNLTILDQGFFAIDGGVWSEGGEAGSLVMADQGHCVILLHLLRAGQDRDHVTRLRRLLVAYARAGALLVARLTRGTCLIQRATTPTLHRIRVAAVVGDLICRDVRVGLSCVLSLTDARGGQDVRLRGALALGLDELALLV